jgi:hypothetical protein
MIVGGLREGNTKNVAGVRIIKFVRFVGWNDDEVV